MPSRLAIRIRNNGQLRDQIRLEMRLRGDACDLNHLDVSELEDFSAVFGQCDFRGNISQWNTSNAMSMNGMFESSKFNGDISRWDVSNVLDMGFMFWGSPFNSDISQWNVGRVQTFYKMFAFSAFVQDVGTWIIQDGANIGALHVPPFEAFLEHQSMSAWMVRFHLENRIMPKERSWYEAFTKMQAMTHALGLSVHQQAHAIVALHESLHAGAPLQPQKDVIDAGLFVQ